jgi:hypothetical protein
MSLWIGVIRCLSAMRFPYRLLLVLKAIRGHNRREDPHRTRVFCVSNTTKKRSHLSTNQVHPMLLIGSEGASRERTCSSGQIMFTDLVWCAMLLV